MNPALQQLKDIHLPQPIHNWPIAPGWLLLYTLLIVILTYLVYLYYQRKKSRSIVNFALSRLNVLENFLIANPENINIAAEISTLIRRTALYYFHRQEIAGLSGKEWLDFLNRSGNTTQFSAAGSLLIDAPYRKNNSSDLLPLFSLTRDWLAAIVKKNSLTAEK